MKKHSPLLTPKSPIKNGLSISLKGKGKSLLQ
jgi:hypothetical protein